MTKTIGTGFIFILAGFILLAVNQLAYAAETSPSATIHFHPPAISTAQVR